MTNGTLSRLIKSSSGLITNPFFRHIGHVVGGAFPFFDHRPGGSADVLTLAPGWYQFGAWPYVLHTGLGATAKDLNPFRQADSPDVAGSGILCTLYGPAATNVNFLGLNLGGAGFGAQYPGGLVQRVRRGRQLLGRRVRVTGSYRVGTSDGGAVVAGMQVWLRGRLQSADVHTTYLSGTNGAVALDGAVTFTDVTFNSFVTSLVQPGDILHVQGQHDNIPLGEGNKHPTRTWEIESVTDEQNIVVRRTGGIGLLKSIGGADWAISRAADGEAGFLGQRGIALHDTSHKVGHVIRLTGPGESYYSGEEWQIRAFDWLAAPWSDGGALATDISSRTLMFGWEGSALTVGGMSLSPIAHAGLQAAYPDARIDGTYLAGEVPPSGAKLFYLDQEDWVDDETLGNFKLVENFQDAPLDHAVKFFEEIVEIPDTMVLDGDDMFLILTPVDPADVVNLSSGIQVAWYSLNVELLPTDDGGVEDRILYDYVSSDPDAMVNIGQETRHYYQYPIYFPTSFPLHVDLRPASLYNGDGFGGTEAEATTGRTLVAGRFPSSGITNVQGDDTFYGKQRPLPPGAVVVGASIWTQSVNGFNVSPGADFYLYDINQKPPYAQGAGGGVGFGAIQTLVGYAFTPDGTNTWNKATFTIHRNRTGLWWPMMQEGPGPWGLDPDDNVHQGNSDLWMSVGGGDVALAGAETNIGIQNGSVIALIDPRLVNSYWRVD